MALRCPLLLLVLALGIAATASAQDPAPAPATPPIATPTAGAPEIPIRDLEAIVVTGVQPGPGL